MIKKNDALNRLLKLAKNKKKQTIPLEECFGRVLACDLIAKHCQPPFDTSAMDGYALKKENKVAGEKFKVIGESSAGKDFKETVKFRETVRIFTGAPLPRGTDSIVIQEDVKLDGDNIILKKNIEPHDFVRKKGSDFSKGYIVKAPIRIQPALVSLIASMNLNKISVYCKPTVAIISTGNELVEPGRKIPRNKIVASNSYGLAAMLTSFGADVKRFCIVKDNLQTIQKEITQALDSDIILTVGGVSVGEYDLVEKSTAALGLELAFHSVAIKPGKPLLAGTIRDTILIGLPGNPVSALLTCQIMVKPVVEKMLGLEKNPKKIELWARLGSHVESNGRREHSLRGILKNESGILVVYPLKKQDSSLISELNKANCLITLAPNNPPLPTGTLIKILPFYTEFN